MGAMHCYKSPEGVWYMFFGHVRGAGYLINPDGTYDEKAKAIADDFNNGGHSVTIDGIEFKIDKDEKKKECNKNKKTSFWKKLFGY